MDLRCFHRRPNGMRYDEFTIGTTTFVLHLEFLQVSVDLRFCAHHGRYIEISQQSAEFQVLVKACTCAVSDRQLLWRALLATIIIGSISRSDTVYSHGRFGPRGGTIYSWSMLQPDLRDSAFIRPTPKSFLKGRKIPRPTNPTGVVAVSYSQAIYWTILALPGGGSSCKVRTGRQS